MLRQLSDVEINAANERRAFLYSSAYTIDNLTAVLMDPHTADLGLHESTARAKAHAIVGWLKTIHGVQIPEMRPAQKAAEKALEEV